MAETPPRHALLRVSPEGWAAMLEMRPEWRGEPLLAGWAWRGWPLVARRRGECETAGGIAAGLPLPPSAGKRRLAVLLPGDAVTEIRPPLPLAEALPSAPPGWRPVLEALLALGAAHRVTPRVFGSLAWAALTGLDYLGPASDLDLLWPVLPPPRMAALLAALGGIEARAPMRLDGEVLLPDGSGANWREIQAGAAEILVKRAGGVALLPRADFLGAAGAA
ncbi:malonate decarboxylase holo-[acyl-carrier-protein] synthase [Roseomonas mucosa]|uniref:Malonate decarboxylase holo-[acyl-carrier-protein] synthase n=1 Tax=Roseomonas mucosa TaxID=207340 RepID=A0A1S8D7U1_9PROT|nr:malonate decarboxylase holo-[acyl-carrier-protein] synthase [Roseomonas mucosa]MDT8275224.1 malonate decarboxylase holo-[acyl-carrier-protein] synthase [Roseomonas mucosa]MDT8355591.1 malonate decarboxylase holo-[acyl-carrier-protein] synthase [Roseomonas mucosa]ONH83588.1 malonate decarboxylase holo-[acyl-carrier-protein] synthase [Roseomonas mucosa]